MFPIIARLIEKLESRISRSVLCPAQDSELLALHRADIEKGMQALQLPSIFQQSCLNSKSYPQNLLHKSTYTYHTALQLYKHRLDAAEPDLFVDDESKVEVSFRDLHNASGKGTGIDASWGAFHTDAWCV